MEEKETKEINADANAEYIRISELSERTSPSNNAVFPFASDGATWRVKLEDLARAMSYYIVVPDLGAIRNDISLIKTDIAGIKRKQTEDRNYFNEKIERADSDIYNIKQDVNALYGDVNSLKSEMRFLDAAYNQLKEKVDTMAPTVNELAQQYGQLNQKVSNLNELYIQLNQTVAGLSRSVSTMVGQVSTMWGKVTTLETKTSTLETKQTEMSQKLYEHSIIIDFATRDIDSLFNRMERRESADADLYNKVAANKNRIDGHDQDISTIIENHDALHVIVDTNTADIVALKDWQLEVAPEISRATIDIETITRDLNTTKDRVADLETTTSQIQTWRGETTTNLTRIDNNVKNCEESILPVGFVYTQLANEQSPQEIWTREPFADYEWQLIEETETAKKWRIKSRPVQILGDPATCQRFMEYMERKCDASLSPEYAAMYFQKSDTPPAESWYDFINIGTLGSDDAKVWYSWGNLYWWSKTGSVSVSSAADFSFKNLASLVMMDLRNWNFSKMTARQGFFNNLPKVSGILSDRDFVFANTLQSGFFVDCPRLPGWDASKTGTDMAKLNRAPDYTGYLRYMSQDADITDFEQKNEKDEKTKD